MSSEKGTTDGDLGKRRWKVSAVAELLALEDLMGGGEMGGMK